MSLHEDYFTTYITTVVADVLFTDISIKIIIINNVNSGITADHSGQSFVAYAIIFNVFSMLFCEDYFTVYILTVVVYILFTYNSEFWSF